MKHVPVLLSEALQYLDLPHRNLVIDSTLGLGGHTEAMLREKKFKGKVLGIDADEQHLKFAKKRLAGFEDRFSAVRMNFSALPEYLREHHLPGDGILFDLGIASPHVDDPKRGFSYLHEGPLDMRLDDSLPETAADLLDRIEEKEFMTILRDFGEEPLARPIAQEIIRSRRMGELNTTLDLSKLIEELYQKRYHRRSKSHPAAKTFQALRIAVNRELEFLEKALQGVIPLLSSGARIVVISYHSLEDRIVKHLFRQLASCRCPPKLPFCACGKPALLRILTSKAVIPSPEEVRKNPRARSAKLRAAQRL